MEFGSALGQKEVIVSDKAPLAIGPYSQAIKCNGMIYCSGCIGMLRETKALINDTVADQTRCALENMRHILEAAGSSMDKVVKCTVLLTDMKHFAEVNAIYAEFFPIDRNPPARACFAVAGLPANSLVEIDCICAE